MNLRLKQTRSMLTLAMSLAASMAFAAGGPNDEENQGWGVYEVAAPVPREEVVQRPPQAEMPTQADHDELARQIEEVRGRWAGMSSDHRANAERHGDCEEDEIEQLVRAFNARFNIGAKEEK